MDIKNKDFPKIRELRRKIVAKLGQYLPASFGLANGEVAGEEVGDVAAEQQGEGIQWAEVMMGFCLASGLQIATVWSQIQSSFPPGFQVSSVFILLSFASIFVSKYIAPKFRRSAALLEQLGIFSAVTAFFIAVTIPLDKLLVITSWGIYAVSLLVIIVCNFFF